MKNLYKLFGIIAIVVIIGFSMTGCDTDESVSTKGRLTITGLNSYYNGAIDVIPESREDIGITYNDDLNTFLTSNFTVIIKGDSVTLHVWKREKGSWKSYQGNDEVLFEVTVRNVPGSGFSGTGTLGVKFNNGIGSTEFAYNP